MARWTARQCELFRLLGTPAREFLIYGGAGSGKTFGILAALIARALKAPGSRHLIGRQRFNHCKASIGQQSLPEVLETAFPGVAVELNKQDWIFTLRSRRGSSELWLIGLDEGERLDKVLGTEFATIYLNEASQISYEGFNVVKTRLRQKARRIEGRDLSRRMIHDGRLWAQSR